MTALQQWLTSRDICQFVRNGLGPKIYVTNTRDGVAASSKTVLRGLWLVQARALFTLVTVYENIIYYNIHNSDLCSVFQFVFDYSPKVYLSVQLISVSGKKKYPFPLKRYNNVYCNQYTVIIINSIIRG